MIKTVLVLMILSGIVFLSGCSCACKSSNACPIPQKVAKTQTTQEVF